MHESWCAETIGKNKKVRCNLCIIGCGIDDGGRGLCRTRENRDGRLINLVHGSLSSFSTDFVEKVPLYHFYPNQRFLTVGSVGCNLSCKFCLTWSITQMPPEEIATENLSSERLVKAARELKCRGIAYTHSEPTLNIEFFSKVMEKARASGLVNAFATNGFITLEAFEKIADWVDAVALTFKGGEEFYRKICGVKYDETHFRRLVEFIKKKDIHLEIVYVLIPGFNDDDKSLSEVIKIAKIGGAPLIFLRFFPSHRMEDTESPSEETLERAINLAYARGVEHVYMENIFQHPGKNTYCPGCKVLLVEREGYGIVSWKLDGKKCPSCGRDISIVGDPLLISSTASSG